jgi:pantetheine-phosphate adenylyltransferase
MIRAVYPGSFDPITRGHLDLIERGSKLFDELIVAVAVNTAKEPLFAWEERIAMIRELTEHIPNVKIDSFRGLAVHYVRSVGAKAILRGIRTFSDFEYEFQMALTNRRLAEDIETVFIMPREEYSFISSSLIKEAVSMGGDVSHFVPDNVLKRLRKKFDTPLE